MTRKAGKAFLTGLDGTFSGTFARKSQKVSEKQEGKRTKKNPEPVDLQRFRGLYTIRDSNPRHPD